MISGQQDFFSSNLVGRIFFSLLNALQDIFFLSSFLCRIFFLKKESCLHLHHMNFFEQQNYNFFLLILLSFISAKTILGLGALVIKFQIHSTSDKRDSSNRKIYLHYCL